jgi:radical SAM protein with 4Fe4S-binding SPASM domain
MMRPIRAWKSAQTGLSYALGREASWGPPLFFMVETTNVCNFRCVYCPQSDPASHFINGRGVMPLDDFRRVVAGLRQAFEVRSISLQRDGEPLLNRRIEDYVAHLTASGIAAGFSSNCSLLDPRRAASLIDAGLRRVKTDFCADAELYEGLRRGGNWGRTLEGIRALLTAAEERSAPFRLHITDLGTHGEGEPEATAALDRTRGLFAQWADRVHVAPVRFHNALGHATVDLGGASPAGGHYVLCHHPWVALVVDHAGRAVACCRDLRGEYVLGNLLEQPADEVWNGEPMRRLRRALARRRPSEIGVCSGCDAPWTGSYSGRTLAAKAVNFLFGELFRT